MSDLDFDDLLAGAVADYRAETATRIMPAGAGAAITTAKHRRSVHAVAMGIVAAILVAVPVAAYATSLHDHGVAPPAGPPSASASPSESTSPSASASPSVAQSDATPGDFDGLGNATLTMPGFPTPGCPSGTAKFVHGRSGSKMIVSSVVADVNGDGAADVVAYVTCGSAENKPGEVIAFHVGAGGDVTTIGLVVGPASEVGPNDLIHKVTGMKVNPDGSIVATVGDYETTFTDGGVHFGIFQDRTYTWNGHAFAQSAGPTSFHVPASVKLTATASPMHFGKAANGHRNGTMTVTIRNTGAAAADHVSIVLVVGPGSVTITGGCTVIDAATGICGDVTIPAGGSRIITVSLTISAADATYFVNNGGLDDGGGTAPTEWQVRVGGLAEPYNFNGLGRAIFD